uniref:Gliding motility-associated ABC transporter ATP-binding subunit GldA n=1 Tax=Roseihalotalea indica TaxID=2867963 RepID=A0AA49JKD7_9BACT|nr:gliding motility-associated ABC transporter ATP-binding subunit GldA [Tunicatimonas sp. TK19036]
MSLIIENLTKTYGTQVAVNHISFTAQPGEIVGFLGPNGAGKSTTMKIATGYLPPTQGSVQVCNYDVEEESVAVRRCLGYLPEHNPLYLDMYVHEYLQFIGSLYEFKGDRLKARVGEMINLCGLAPEQRKKIGALSKGYRQRVGLAQALIHDPQVLILDEPTTGLDPNQLSEIRTLIKEISREKTVIFSTHIMQEVQALCDRVIIINRGNIVIDSELSALQRGDGKQKEEVQRVEVTFIQPIDETLLRTAVSANQLEKKHGTTYEIEAIRGQEDIRPAIFRFACEHQYVLIGMQQIAREERVAHGASLEEIFRSLTANQENPA